MTVFHVTSHTLLQYITHISTVYYTHTLQRVTQGENPHNKYLHTDCTECYIQLYIPFLADINIDLPSFPLNPSL